MLSCARQCVYKFLMYSGRIILSPVTQAAHLCISDQKHLQRKHCIKIPGFGLSFSGLRECLRLLNSDPSVSLWLHKEQELNAICVFTPPTSSITCAPLCVLRCPEASGLAQKFWRRYPYSWNHLMSTQSRSRPKMWALACSFPSVPRDPEPCETLGRGSWPKGCLRGATTHGERCRQPPPLLHPTQKL